MVDPLFHFLDAPGRPGPELRRHEVIAGNPRGFGPLGDVPVEAGVVDQDDGVGPLPEEVIPGLIGEPEEDDLIDWDFLRSSGAGQPDVILAPSRGPLKIYQREKASGPEAGEASTWKVNSSLPTPTWVAQPTNGTMGLGSGTTVES